MGSLLRNKINYGYFNGRNDYFGFLILAHQMNGVGEVTQFEILKKIELGK